jgi:hypothetical protein
MKKFNMSYMDYINEINRKQKILFVLLIYDNIIIFILLLYLVISKSI